LEYYDTIFTVMESPVAAGTIWSGSDDGLVYVTRDGGKNWSNVTPSKDLMPEWIQINSLDASPFDAGTAYVAATMYKFDDKNRIFTKRATSARPGRRSPQAFLMAPLPASSRRSKQARSALRRH